MKNYFIIHGSNGHSKENWFPWMKKSLEEKGYECIVPDFPCENGHILSEWYSVLDKYKEKITPETTFIVHSRGLSFLLNLLRDYDYRIDKLVAVGGFIENLWHKPGTPKTTFFAKEFDFERVKSRCNTILNYQSDNDPYIPVEHGKRVSEALDAKYVLIQGAGHFNSAAGYTDFPKLLEDLLGK